MIKKLILLMTTSTLTLGTPEGGLRVAREQVDIRLTGWHAALSSQPYPFMKESPIPSALSNTRFHALQHTCATLLLKAGQHPKTVQALLGHANIGSHSIPTATL